MPELTERDAELLFAYIDGELPPDEVTALENRLNTDDFLRRELASLRQMVILIHTLPEVKAPRNFTLTPAMVAPKTASKLEELPTAEPMIAATTMAASPAQMTPKIVSKPTLRRVPWQSFTAAAAVFVLAIGFIAVAFNNSQSTPTGSVAAAPTAATFSNVIVSQENITTPELKATGSSDAASNMALPVTGAISSAETDILEETARQDPTETAGLEQPRTTELQPEVADIMNAPADTEMGVDDLGGASEIDSQVPGFSINPDPNISGFTVATLPPDALYYIQMTTTPLPPAIVPNEANPVPAIAAQMTFAPDSLATTAESAEAGGETFGAANAVDETEDGLAAGETPIFTPNVRDGFLVLNGFLLLQWFLNRFVLEQP